MGVDSPPPPFQTCLHCSENSEASKSKQVTVLKIYLTTFTQKGFENFHISELLRGQRSAAGIFTKLKALDISLRARLHETRSELKPV